MGETVTGTVARVTRLRSTSSGNPVFRFTLEGGRDITTAPDTGAAYVVLDGWSAQRVRLELDGKGRAYGIEPLD